MDPRWRLWHQAYESGVACGAKHGAGRWQVTCDLPPDHEPPHEARRGFGTVVHAQWPWQRLPDRDQRRRRG